MSRPFFSNNVSANSAFANQKPISDAGDYITQKKIKYSFCKPNICHPNKNVNTQSNLLNLKQANSLAFYPYSNFDKTQLYSNLYSSLVLNSNVQSFSNLSGQYPVNVDPDTISWTNYIIDPSGQLFGLTPCGIQNFENYVVYNSCTYLNN
jgi:hypothetical protein